MVGRYDHIDGELGMVMEPEVLPEDIYPFHLVDTTSPPTTESHTLTLICLGQIIQSL